jgi:L-2,4-diaminobutyrate decarboxylase
MLFAATPPRADADATAFTGPATDPLAAPTADAVTGNPDAGGADHLGGGNLLATASAPSLTGHLVEALSAMRAGAAERNDRPLPTADPDTVLERVGYALRADPLPERGVGARDALRSLCALAGWGAADAAHPFCAGHLHTPPLGAAVAADTVASVLNQSLDSWDQAPAMVGLETEVVRALGTLVYGAASATSGVVTTGGTESNLMGLLLARAAACREHWGVDVMRSGLPARAGALRVYCSEAAHFSTQRMAAVLGLGEDCVVSVPVDAHQRMRADELERLLDASPETVPMAVVATAGTTDAGAVDPVPALAAIARAHGCWLHVDAAYGGGALFSDRLSGLLHGMPEADSVALDLHKLGWQPTAAGVFLARGSHALAPLARQVAYLNTADDEEAGYTSLLGRSLRTTRRPDVLKIAVTLRGLGRRGLGELVDRCHDLARHAATGVDAHPRLQRALPVTLTSVVFRYAPGDGADPDGINARIRRDLLSTGRAVVGRCELGGQVWLKLTLLNPHATTDDVEALLDLVARTGLHLEAAVEREAT